MLSPLKGLGIMSSRFAFCILGTGPVVASSDIYIYIHMYKHTYGTLKGGYRDDKLLGFGQAKKRKCSSIWV